ncbi:MAG TPA: hypothetical protein IAB65_03710 [Candidatus Onthocola stercorigallinarum]|nr:hypothetical protein [Candidatus Onthocola stercorigallinarum]
MNILNIKNQDIEEIIRDSIKEVKEKLKGLDYNQTCLIYSSALFEILKRKHILVHIINTLDLGYSYLHQFLLVYDGNKYYLIDLTYKQFNDNSLSDLNENGYIEIDDNTFKFYLKVVTNNDLTMDLSEAFLKKGR